MRSFGRWARSCICDDFMNKVAVEDEETNARNSAPEASGALDTQTVFRGMEQMGLTMDKLYECQSLCFL